jgi:hypothetical protein
VTFNVEGRPFYAHRIALLASSEAFRAMFGQVRTCVVLMQLLARHILALTIDGLFASAGTYSTAALGLAWAAIRVLRDQPWLLCSQTSKRSAQQR